MNETLAPNNKRALSVHISLGVLIAAASCLGTAFTVGRNMVTKDDLQMIETRMQKDEDKSADRDERLARLEGRMSAQERLSGSRATGATGAAGDDPPPRFNAQAHGQSRKADPK